MNMNIIVGAIVLVVLLLALLAVIRHARNGHGCCDGGKSQCENCSLGCHDSKAKVRRTED